MNIVIDAVFLQFNQWSGIATYWKILLERLDNYLDQFSDNDKIHIYLLVRGRSSPVRTAAYRKIKKLYIGYFDYRCALSDFMSLGDLCKEIGADMFISSYYTLAYGVPNLGFFYDLIPEHENITSLHAMWLAKSIYARSLSHALAISSSTRHDLSRYYPGIVCEEEYIFYPPFQPTALMPMSSDRLADFRSRHKIHYPYIAVVGNRRGYKNVDILKRALASRGSGEPRLGIGIVMTSGELLDHDEQCIYSHHFAHGCRRIELSTHDMKPFIQSADMLFYPSLYEGFGYPVAESLAMGTPVITTGSTSIAEIISLADPREYRLINGFHHSDVLPAIIDLMHRRPTVSARTKIRIHEKFAGDHSARFLDTLQSVAPNCRPPVDCYLPQSIPLDGFQS